MDPGPSPCTAIFFSPLTLILTLTLQPARPPFFPLQYVLGSSILFAVLNALEGVIMSLLSKVVSPELAKGTFNSGLLATEAGTLGRVVGDTMLTCMSERLEAGVINGLFVPIALGVLLSILLTYRHYDSLKSDD